MLSTAIQTWQTTAALTLPSLSVIYAITVQVFNAGNEDCSWCHLAEPISIRVAILVVTLGIVNSKGGLDHANTVTAVVVIGFWSVILMRRIRVIYINGPIPKVSLRCTGLTNRVFMVTGANAGIGRETARQLVAAGATVIMACRNEHRAKVAMENIILSVEKKGSDVDGIETSELKIKSQEVRERLIFLQLDVSNVTSVRKAVQSFLDMKLPLHVLINNAGIIMGERVTNSKGWELTMAANHLGHFLLTNLLLPVLQQQEDARVIILTSTYYSLSKKEGIDLDDLNCDKKKYSMFYQYSQSKLANILMGMELKRRETERVRDEGESAVTVHMVHPGLVRTNIVKNMKTYVRYPNLIFGFILQSLQKTPEAGAYTSVFCATDKALRGNSGEYYINSEATALIKCAQDSEAAKGLWEFSSKLVEL